MTRSRVETVVGAFQRVRTERDYAQAMRLVDELPTRLEKFAVVDAAIDARLRLRLNGGAR